MPKGLAPVDPFKERTYLTPEQERNYQQWVKHYKLKDVDPKTGENWPDVFYDTRGYWKENTPKGKVAGYGPTQFEGQHGPDTYKQHGHPTFSVESKYSRGPFDGGMWIPGTENYFPEMRPVVSHKRRK